MTRRRWVQINGELVEVDPSTYEPTVRSANAMWGDRHYDGQRTQDGVDISTRTKHREYMKARGLSHADDYKETWAKAQRQREAFMTRGTDPTRREDVARAIFGRRG